MKDPCCFRCGTILRAEASFCGSCGAQVDFDFDLDIYIYGMALLGARDLPELNLFLIIGWCTDVRRQPFIPSNWLLEWDQTLAEASKRGQVQKPTDQEVIANIAYLVLENKQIGVREAHREYLESLARGRTRITPEAELNKAVGEIKKILQDWLTCRGIPFSTKPHVRLATSRLTNLLEPYRGQPGFYLAPEIPWELKQNAMDNAGVPEAPVDLAAIIDCTFWGSAKRAIVFGSRALYYYDGETHGYVPYSEFTECLFARDGESIWIRKGEVLSLSFAGGLSAMLAEALTLIKQEVANHSRLTDSPRRGLAAVAGMKELKQILVAEVVEPWRNPAQYKRYRITIPNGILLYGPPGCGKTYIAKCLATELGYPFFHTGPSDVASSYVHGSTLRIRQLFDSAARSAPSVLFIDEIEGLVPDRNSLGGHEQYKAEEVNEFLMQIATCAQRNILLIGATNSPWKIDVAVWRTGRFDKKIYVGPPDEEAREEMLRMHLQGRPVVEDMRLKPFAAELNGYSASDLKALVEEAAKLAMHTNDAIRSEHFKVATIRVPPSIGPQQEELYKFASRGPTPAFPEEFIE